MWRQRLLPSGHFIFAKPWLPDRCTFDRKKSLAGNKWLVLIKCKSNAECYCEHQCCFKECDVGILVKKGQMTCCEASLFPWICLWLWLWRWAPWTIAGQQRLESETSKLNSNCCQWSCASGDRLLTSQLSSSYVVKETYISPSTISAISSSLNFTSTQHCRIIPVWLMKQLLSSWDKSFLFIMLFALWLPWPYRLSAEFQVEGEL